MLSAYLNLYSKLFLMQIGPQDVPASKALFWITLAILLFGGMVIGSHTYSITLNLAINLFDAALFAVFIFIILIVKGYPNRFIQTAAASFGVCALFYILLLPALLMMEGGFLAENNPILVVAFLYQISLFVYSVFVFANILSHALSTSRSIGIALAFIYYLVSFLLINNLFPIQS